MGAMNFTAFFVEHGGVLMPNLTKHGSRRLRHRLSTSMQSDKEYLQRVIKYGLLPSEVRGELADFMRGKAIQNGTSHVCRIYAQAMHIFTKEESLVTVYRLPKDLIPEADKQGAEKHRRVKEEKKAHKLMRERAKREKYLERRRAKWMKEYEKEIDLRI